MKVLQNTLHIASYDGLRPNTVQDLEVVLDSAADPVCNRQRAGSFDA